MEKLPSNFVSNWLSSHVCMHADPLLTSYTSGEVMAHRTAIVEDGARLDVFCMRNFFFGGGV